MRLQKAPGFVTRRGPRSHFRRYVRELRGPSFPWMYQDKGSSSSGSTWAQRAPTCRAQGQGATAVSYPPAHGHVSWSQPTGFLSPWQKTSTFCLQNIIYIKTKRRKITGRQAYLVLSDKCKIGFYKLEGSCLQGVRGNLHKDDLFSYYRIEAVHLKWIKIISCV